MKISRQVGTASQILNVYAQDFSVTTGAGIANIPATTVSYSWFRNNHAGVSTGVGVSTASMGTYTSGAWTQINSATALGWYQFCIPNDALLTGDCSALLLRVSTGAFAMAPIPVEIELTKTNNQQYASSTVYSSTQIVASVTSTLTVSTQTIDKGGYGVTTIASNITTNANVMQAYGSAIVTSASGQFQVSTQAIDKGGYGVTSLSAAVTTTANVVQWLGVAAVGGNGHVGVDWANVTNKASYNDLSSTFISTNQSIAGASAPTAAVVAQAVWDEIATSHSASSSFAQVLKLGMSNVSTLITGVNITSIVGTAAVTSAGGQLRVSTQTIDKTAYTLATGGINFAAVSSDAWPLWGVLDAGDVGAISGTSFTGSSAVLRNASSSYPTDTLTGTSLFVYNVTTGAGQRRFVTDWTSTDAVANVDNWLITPTQTTAKYVLFATAPASSSNVPDVNLVKVLGTTSPARPGYVGIDWAFVTSKAAYNDLSSTFISTNQSIAGASAPTAAQVAVAVWDEIATSHTASSSFAVVLKNGMSNVSTVMTGVNITSIVGTAAVTSAGGQLRVSTQAIDKGGYGVTTIASNITTNANLLQIYGTAAVTSAGGTLTVSTQTLAGMSGSVNVSSIMGQPAATTGAGILLVSTQAIDKGGYGVTTIAAAEQAALAGMILTTTMAETYRSVNALGSLSQLTYEVLANITDMGNSGTTRTLNSVTSHTALTVQYQYDSTTPSAITRIG